MPSLATLLTFCVAALILIVIPGPSVLFAIGRAIALGRAAGVTSVAGNTTGTFVLVTAVAFGVGAVVEASEVAFVVLKFAGAAYLVFLGVQTIRHRKAAAAAAAASNGRESLGRVYRQAIVVGLTNPKSLAFFVAVLPQFADPTRGHVPLQLWLMGAIFCVIAFCSDSVWGLAAGTARNWFARSPRRIERLSATGGVMMIALGGVLAAARRGTV